jgi:hypothetical protein
MNAVLKPESLPEPVVPGHITPTQVRTLGEMILKQPNYLGKETCDQLTSHFFCEGLYMREFFLPAGALVVGRVHREESFFMVIVGDATISLADGSIRRVRAPYLAVTQPGGQRVVAAHEDTVFLTFHPNPDNGRDIDALEARLSEPEYQPPMEQLK